MPKTRSPGASPSTLAPMLSTTPANSKPSASPASSLSASLGNSPVAAITSRKLRPAAATRTRTSFVLGVAASHSCQESVSMPCGRCGFSAKLAQLGKREAGRVRSTMSSGRLALRRDDSSLPSRTRYSSPPLMAARARTAFCGCASDASSKSARVNETSGHSIASVRAAPINALWARPATSSESPAARALRVNIKMRGDAWPGVA